MRFAPPSEMQRRDRASTGSRRASAINTGEVVVGGEGETLVTGDAVNVAARLEQAAAAGEILIGAETRALVRDAVRVEPVEPLDAEGKVASRLRRSGSSRSIERRAPLARHPETPLVGRERERQRLWRDYEDAVADSTCRLFTLLGPAGIGKSRLVADFLERVGDVGRRPARPLPLLRRGDHLLAARRDPDRDRRRAGRRSSARRRPRRSSRSGGCSRRAPRSVRRSS